MSKNNAIEILKAYQQEHENFKHAKDYYLFLDLMTIFGGTGILIAMSSFHLGETLLIILFFSTLSIVLLSMLDIAMTQNNYYSLHYMWFSKHYKLQNKLLNIKFVGSLSEIFDLEDKEIQKIVLKYAEKIEKDLIDKKYISGSILLSISNDIAFMKKCQKERIEQENLEMQKAEETAALMNANTKVGLSLKELYKLQENAKLLEDK